MNSRIILFFLAIAFLSSCDDNELDINAPWKETPVVYAVVNAGQDSQIFRIQKTYQNSINQSTSEVAQIADSLVFNNITVELKNNITGEIRPLKRLAPRKSEGLFSNKDSSYWGENLKGFLNPAHVYTLIIKSFNTGNTYHGITTVVDSCDINSNTSVIDLYNVSPQSFIFRINSGGRNASSYNLGIRFKYIETFVGSASGTQKSFDYYFVSNKVNPNASPLGVSNNAIAKSGVLDFLKRTPQKNAGVTRTFSSLEYVFIGVNRTYMEMIEVNTPSSSVIAKGADFSNISDGIGVFASRTETAKQQLVSDSSISIINKLLNP